MSYTSIKKEKVVELCKATIAQVKVSREQADKRSVEKHLDLYNWFRRPLCWLGIKQLTEEDADKRLREGDTGYFYPSFKGYGIIDTAEKLLKLADNSDAETLNVSADDLAQIA